MLFALRHWRILAKLAALVAAFLFGAQVGSEFQIGRHARAEAARLAAEAEHAAATNRAEAVRLMGEAEADATLRSLTDEARADPDGAMPALGMRDARRINAIR